MHWKRAEALPHARALREAGYRVTVYDRQGGEGLRALRDRPPDAVVIDLNRLPSHGRAVAVFLRQQRGTRETPILFIRGEREKTARTQKLLPDAVYTTWSRLPAAIGKATRSEPKKPVVPGTMAGYSGTPLAKKLGIRAGSKVALLGAPAGFEGQLEPLPEGSKVSRRTAAAPDVMLLFVKTQADLGRRFADAAKRVATGGKLWICWPKQDSGKAKDLNGNQVRAFGLARRWVDFKVCAVDATWSGLCFSRRR